jgi:uncharacterized membrane protein YbhN (UPF0104 family)
VVPDPLPPGAIGTVVAPRALVRNGLLAALGLATGALFLWLALRKADLAELRAVAAAVDLTELAFATLLYWAALGLRVVRWQLLLRQLAPAPLAAVGETLVVGYAINNVLPARLGEVVRAAYAKRRLRIGRARVFGSIVVERVLDLAAILTCLGAGLVLLRLARQGLRLATFELIALNAGAVIGVATLALCVLRSASLPAFALPAPIMAVLEELRAGAACLNRRSAALALVLSACIWLLEVVALAQTFSAVGEELLPAQALLVMGAASLSTLVPTAPGYLGTYQLVFVLAMNAFGASASAGIVAATAIQVFLFGSVTVAGCAILGVRASRRLLRVSPAG